MIVIIIFNTSAKFIIRLKLDFNMEHIVGTIDINLQKAWCWHVSYHNKLIVLPPCWALLGK